MNHFEILVSEACDNMDWISQDINDIYFTVNLASSLGGEDLMLFGWDSEDFIELSIDSFVKFDSLENIPSNLSTALLEKNNSIDFGQWSINNSGEEYVFSIKYSSLKIRFISDFLDIVNSLYTECDEFNNILISLSDESNEYIDTSEFGKNVANGAGLKLGGLAVSGVLALFGL